MVGFVASHNTRDVCTASLQGFPSGGPSAAFRLSRPCACCWPATARLGLHTTNMASTHINTTNLLPSFLLFLPSSPHCKSLLPPERQFLPSTKRSLYTSFTTCHSHNHYQNEGIHVHCRRWLHCFRCRSLRGLWQCWVFDPLLSCLEGRCRSVRTPLAAQLTLVLT